MTYLKLSNIIQASFITVVALHSAAFGATEFQYFGSDIDFWHEQKAKPQTVTAEKKEHLSQEKKPGGEAVTEPAERFLWQKFLDPKNKEFFKEGDYTPPEPFMEIVRSPTDANLKLWFSYIEKKNELSDRLQVRMREYMEKNSLKLGEAGQQVVKAKVANLPKVEPDAKRFRFRMYFDSHCPHCKKMFGTLAELQGRGFYVEARQVDNDPRGTEGLSIPTQRASPSEIKERGIQSVPLLLVGDLQKKAVYRLTGFQSVSSIFEAISQGGTMN